MSKTFSLLTFLTLLTFFFIFAVVMVSQYLLALFMGVILSVACHPVFQRICRWGVRKEISSLIVTLGAVLIIMLPAGWFLGVAIQQGFEFGQWLQTHSFISIHDSMVNLNDVTGAHFSGAIINNAESQLESFLKSLTQSLSSFLLALAVNLPESVLQIFIVALACYFFLIDGERFVKWTSQKIPLSPDISVKITNACRNTAISSLWATMAASAAQAFIMTISFIALGVPSAFLAGGATFIFGWIPFIGSAPVAIAGVAYLWVEDAWIKAVLMLFLGLFAGTIDNVVRPWVLKGRGEMHPLVSLIAIFGGIKMFNLFGVFIGPIIAALVITLLQVWPTVARRVGIELPQNIIM